MDVYEYIYSKETTTADFISALTSFIKNTDMCPHRPFSAIENGVVLSLSGLDRFVVEAVLKTITEDRDHGIELFVMDAVTDMHGHGDDNLNQDTVTIDRKYAKTLKDYSVMGLYKKLRKFTTRFVASRATITVLVNYRRALGRRN